MTLISDISTLETSLIESEALLPAVQKEYEIDLARRPNWSVEANFMLLPIFNFDKKAGAKASSVLVQSLPVVKKGVIVSSSLSITTGERQESGKLVKDHRPGAFDMSVLFCLMDIWDEQGKPESGIATFRLNTVCNRLKMNDSGRSYEQIKNAILRLSRTKIESTNAYYSQEKADYVNLSMSILDDATIAVNSGSGKSQGGCSVKIGRHILTNLLNNYTAKVNRQIYQQLDVGFAQRILCLVLFKQQIENEVGVIDFELLQLAELLPMSGKLYPSTIINRLEKALEELRDKKIFKSEFLKVGAKHVLRLIPCEQQDAFLVGPQNAQRFTTMILKVYKKALFELIDLTDSMLLRLVERDFNAIEFSERKYTWTYHVVDVFCHMIKFGYVAKDKARMLKTLLSLKESDLEVPFNFRPIDVVYKEMLQRESLEQAVSTRDLQTKEADSALYDTGLKYVDRLPRHLYDKYEKRVFESRPELKDFPGFQLRLEIANLLVGDMKNGVRIDLDKPLMDSRQQIAREIQQSLDFDRREKSP